MIWRVSTSSTTGRVAYSDRFSRGANLTAATIATTATHGRATPFTLPAATKYGTVTFKVLGKSPAGYGAPDISVYNAANDSFDGDRLVSTSYRWSSTSVAGSSHVSSTACLWLRDGLRREQCYYDVAKVQLTYKYAKLR